MATEANRCLVKPADGAQTAVRGPHYGHLAAGSIILVPMDTASLINRATDYLNPAHRGDRTSGGVAAAILSKQGELFVGVCIDTACGMGFCAEHAAVAAMVTAGQSEIAMVVAVTRDIDSGALQVLPPCGRCREFIYQVDDRNLDARVVLGSDTISTIAELLPERQARQVRISL